MINSDTLYQIYKIITMTVTVSEISAYFTLPQVQVFLVVVLVAVIIKSFMKGQNDVVDNQPESEPQLPEMEKQDFTLEELRKYNGNDDPRILLGINGNVYDVTRGKGFYGPGGPYGVFAGRDASRCFATFSTDPSIIKEEDDDLSDLNYMQMESLREWEAQMSEKYTRVGKLLKSGEEHTNYNKAEEESEDDSKAETEKKDD